MRDRRGFFPDLGILRIGKAGQTGVGIVRAPDLLFDITGIDKGGRAVNIDDGLDPAGKP